MTVEPSLETQFATLDRTIPDAEAYALAQRHAPRIRFDAREPFLPLTVAIPFSTKWRASVPREILLTSPSVCAIE